MNAHSFISDSEDKMFGLNLSKYLLDHK